METWMFYALLGSFVIGMYGFLQKVQTEIKVNRSAFIIYSHVGLIIYSLFYLLYTGGVLSYDINLILYAFLITAIYVVIMVFRLKSLKYLDTSSFFINYRIFSSILLLILGQVIYNDVINYKEYIGIFIGFLTFYLLLDKKYKSEPINKVIKGYIYLFIGIVGVSIIWVIQKYFVLQNLDFTSFLLYSGITGVLMTMLFNFKQDSLRQMFMIKKKNEIVFLTISGLLFPFAMIFNLMAINYGGDIAIIYKIISYSLFIPIILSIFYYNDKVTYKKIIAFILTVVSIMLFV